MLTAACLASSSVSAPEQKTQFVCILLQGWLSLFPRSILFSQPRAVPFDAAPNFKVRTEVAGSDSAAVGSCHRRSLGQAQSVTRASITLWTRPRLNGEEILVKLVRLCGEESFVGRTTRYALLGFGAPPNGLLRIRIIDLKPPSRLRGSRQLSLIHCLVRLTECQLLNPASGAGDSSSVARRAVDGGRLACFGLSARCDRAAQRSTSQKK